MLGFKTNHTKNAVIKKLNNLTLIDYLGLLIIIGVGLFFVFKFSRQEKTVLVDLTFERVSPGNNFFPPEYWQATKISLGDAVYNSLGNKIAVIKNVKRLPWGGGSRFYTYLTIEMVALYHSANRTYTYEGKPLVVGQTLPFLISNVSYTGVVKNMYLPGEKKIAQNTDKKARIRLYCREYEPWHAEALRSLSVKDQEGTVMAEVTDATITPAQVAIETADGRIVEGRHPFKKDLDLTIMLNDLNCTSEGYCLYNEMQSFTIGSQLWLDSGKTWLGANCSVKEFTLLDP